MLGGVATFVWDFASQRAECSAEFFRIFGLPAQDGVMTPAEWAAAHSDAEVDVDRVADGIHASAEGITAWWLATRDDEGLAAVVRGFAAGVARTR